MKLLFLLQELPFPPSNGFRQKIFNLISYMGRNHRCDVIALGTQDDLDRSTPWVRQIWGLRILGVFPPDQVPFLRTKQWFKLLLSHDSPSWLRFRSHALKQAIDSALSEENYDAAHVDLQGMAQYCKKLGPLKRVLSLNDSMSLTLFGAAKNHYAPFWVRLAAFAKAWPQMLVDKAQFRLADAVHFVGAYDTDWCKRSFKISNAVYIPLAVESAFLQIEGKKDKADGSRKIIIVDKLWASQHRNAVKNFLSKFWAGLYNKYPYIKLIVIGGKGMPTDFQHYVRNLPGVELHDWVDRLEDTLAETEIAVFPYSVAVGMKTRVLECMAAKNAVIGTSDAFRGLPVRHKQHVFIVKDQNEMAMGIEELLLGDVLRDQMGQSARELINQHFTQETIGAAWERLYEDVHKGSKLRDSYI